METAYDGEEALRKTGECSARMLRQVAWTARSSGDRLAACCRSSGGSPESPAKTPLPRCMI
ncbi:hypothetical protein [Paenibacillus oleatilyticus]|uniref:Uncharacterized protein n=1 Tax=Paenibacillus oleatilyticus TaxID=2594886 RepID=A0ABV4V7I6_9BACL